MIQQLGNRWLSTQSRHWIRLNREGQKRTQRCHCRCPEEATFSFYVDVDKPLGFSLTHSKRFYRLIKQVCSDAFDFHLYRGDFERWLSDALNDKELASEIAEFRTKGLKGEDLRKAILKTIDNSYGVGELL